MLLTGLIALVAIAGAVTAASAAEPTASINPATEASYTSVHLSGAINPHGQDTTYRFEWGTTPIEAWTGSPQLGPVLAGAGETPVSFDATGLRPGREYAAYLLAENAEGFAITSQVNFTTLPVGHPTVSIAAPSAITTTSAQFSGHIDPEAPGGNPSAFDVNWHFVCTPECPGLTGGTIPADSTDHEVTADTTGLKLGTEYKVELVAENAAGPVAVGPESFTTLTVLPQLGDLKVSPLSTEAEIWSTINPGGAATTYHFEYGPTESYGQSTVTRTVPAGESPVRVSANLFGLSPETGYHFRLITSNSVGSVDSPDRAFTTSPLGFANDRCPNLEIRVKQGSQYLPDCRAYERVTPAENGGVPVAPGNSLGFRATPDGDQVLYGTRLAVYPGAESAPLEARVAGRRTEAGWSFQPLDKPTSNAVFQFTGGMFWATLAVSKDMTRSLIISSRALGGQGVEGGGNLYVYDTRTDRYSLIMSGPAQFFVELSGPNRSSLTWLGATPDFRTVAFELGQPNEVYIWSEGTGLRTVTEAPEIGYGIKPEGLSLDGSRLYYTNGQGVFLDEDGVKTAVSVSHRAGDPSTPVYGKPQVASPDGRYLFFKADGALTEDAPEGTNLYRYDADSGDLEYLTNLSPFPENGSFSENGILEGWPERDEAYFRDGASYYRLRDGEVTLVAADVLPDDVSSKAPFSASADGRYFAFLSGQQLTSFDNHGMSEIYLYEAETNALTCVSCRSDDGIPTGSASLGGATFGNLEFENRPSRTVSDDGTVYFDTPDPLLPTDVNGRRDVYSYHEGRLSLISPGKEDVDAEIAEVTPSGHDVFFTTEQRLVASDTDGAMDIYDARVEGGIAAQNATAIPPCLGDACRGASPPAPEPLNAATETLYGPGNPHAASKPRCRRQGHAAKRGCKKHKNKVAKHKKPARNRGHGR